MPSFMAVLFNSGKITSLLGEYLMAYFMWLRLHKTNDKHGQQKET